MLTSIVVDNRTLTVLSMPPDVVLSIANMDAARRDAWPMTYYWREGTEILMRPTPPPDTRKIACEFSSGELEVTDAPRGFPVEILTFNVVPGEANKLVDGREALLTYAYKTIKSIELSTIEPTEEELA